MSAASPISEVSSYCSDPLYHIESSQVGEGGAVPLTPCPLGTSEREIHRDNPAILAHCNILEHKTQTGHMKGDQSHCHYSKLTRESTFIHLCPVVCVKGDTCGCTPCSQRPSAPASAVTSCAPEGLGRLRTNQPHHTHLPGTPRPLQVWMGSASKRLPQPSPPSQLERQHRVSMYEIFASFNYRRTKSCNASPQAF